MGLRKNSEDLENLRSLRFSWQALGGQSLKAFAMEEKRATSIYVLWAKQYVLDMYLLNFDR